ncbi:MAG: hypothetical protein ACK4J0_02330 [Candidatus Anstonellaceae archaeon]
MQKLIKESIEEEPIEKNLKKELQNPLVDEEKSKIRLIDPSLHSEFVYEFRKTRFELEQSAERIIRLAKIGILINKMKHKEFIKK